MYNPGCFDLLMVPGITKNSLKFIGKWYYEFKKRTCLQQNILTWGNQSRDELFRFNTINWLKLSTYV